MLCASLCTATSALHGGLMLYNGGFTTGLAALILIPILEHYSVPKRREMKQYINLQDMMTMNETASRTARGSEGNETRKKYGTTRSSGSTSSAQENTNEV